MCLTTILVPNSVIDIVMIITSVFIVIGNWNGWNIVTYEI